MLKSCNQAGQMSQTGMTDQARMAAVARHRQTGALYKSCVDHQESLRDQTAQGPLIPKV